MFVSIIQAVIVCIWLTNLVDSNLDGIPDENVLYTLPEFTQYIGRVKRAGEKTGPGQTTVRIKVLSAPVSQNGRSTGPQNGRTYDQPTLSSLAKQKGNSSAPCPRVHGEDRQYLFQSNVPASEQQALIQQIQKGVCTTLGEWDVTLDTNRDQLTSKNIEYLETKIKTMESFVEQLGADVNTGRDYILKMIQEQGGDIQKAQIAAEAEASKFTDKTQQGVNRFNALLKTLETSITENFRRQIDQVRQELRTKEHELAVVRGEKALLENQVDKYSKEAAAAKISKREMEETRGALEDMVAKKKKEAKDLENTLDEAYKAHTAKMAKLDAETERRRTEVEEMFKKLAAAQSKLDETNKKIKILSYGEEERKKRYEDVLQSWKDRENTDIKFLNKEKERLSKDVDIAANKLKELQAGIGVELNEIRGRGEDSRKLSRDLELNSAKLSEATERVDILIKEKNGLKEQLEKANGDLVRLNTKLSESQQNEVILQERLEKAAAEFVNEQNRAQGYVKKIEEQTKQLEVEQNAKNANAALVEKLKKQIEETTTKYALQARSVQEMRDQAAGYQAQLQTLREQLQKEREAHLETKKRVAFKEAQNKRLELLNANYARLTNIIAYEEVGVMRKEKKKSLIAEIEKMFKQTPELYQKLLEQPKLKRDMDDKWLQLISSPAQNLGNGVVKAMSFVLNKPVDSVAKKGRQFKAFIDDFADREENPRRTNDPDPYGYWQGIIPPKAEHYYYN